MFCIKYYAISLVCWYHLKKYWHCDKPSWGWLRLTEEMTFRFVWMEIEADICMYSRLIVSLLSAFTGHREAVGKLTARGEKRLQLVCSHCQIPAGVKLSPSRQRERWGHRMSDSRGGETTWCVFRCMYVCMIMTETLLHRRVKQDDSRNDSVLQGVSYYYCIIIQLILF